MKKLLIFGSFSLCMFVFFVAAYAYAQEETATPTESTASTSTPATGRKKPFRTIKDKRNDAMRKRGQGAMKKLAGKGNRVHLVGAEVTAVGGDTITVEKDGKTYTVNTDIKTKFRRHFWGKSELVEFSIGNMVNIWGTWADETQTTINAKMIKNLSI
ncbi:MAG: hypothetical protein HY431_00520, partial [Candidatus Levybacteria bacterium]|nr:hypothetical protein [Candidatus Levybacteria bacterium]